MHDRSMNTPSRHVDSTSLPLEQSYLSLQQAFEQAIALEVLLAQRKPEDAAGEAAPGELADAPPGPGRRAA